MNFRLTARDNKNGGGGVGFSSTDVVVDGGSGPFQVSSQNAATLWINNGTNTADITWDVNGTDEAPLNTTNVKISFSTDGGATFPVIIAATTPNNGLFNYAIPNVATTQGRIKIEAIGNVYFDINNVNITISSICSPEVSNITPVTTIDDSPGGANLNLVQTSYGVAITSLSGSVESTDEASNLVFSNSGSCSGPSNSNKYDLFEFYVSNSGDYTFTYSGDYGLIMNLYSNSYDKNSVCTNWLASSGSSTGGNVSPSYSLTKTLTPGKYVITISSFSNGLPSLPSAYTISNTGGTINEIAPMVNSPYGYTYLIYDTASGSIIAFQADPDLTAFSAGNYRIYGLSYQGGFNLTPYVSTAFTNFQTQLSNGSVCGTLSENFRNVNISSTCSPEVSNITPVTIIDDSPGGANLNLVQTSYGAAITSLSGSVESTDPSGNNVSNDGSGSCFGPFNSMNYDVHTFYIATSGTYTFSRTVRSGSLMLALYDQPYSSGNPCANFLISSGTYNGSNISLSDSLTQELTPGTYYLVVSSFSFDPPRPSLPAAYTITPSGGNVYGISPAPDSPYGYTYLIYDTASGSIIAFQADPDLTAFSAGNYRIYGLSYQGGFNLTPYVSTAFTNFQTQLSNGSVCGTLSENFRNVNITSPCPPSLTLVAPTDNIASGTVKQEVSGTITATNKVTGGNVKYDAGQNIQLNPGFVVDSGVVFSAYIDGCDGQ
jgi:hypothetical protein